MADPFTLAGLGIAASVGGAGLGAFSAIMGGDAKSKMFQYQAGIADYNSKVAKQNADYERKAGEIDANISGQKTKFILGNIKASQGARHIDVNSGSAVQVRESQTAVGKRDQDQIRSNSARRAYGYEVEAANKTAQAAIYRSSASNAQTEGYLGAAKSILGGVSSVSGKWLQGNQAGLWGGSGGSDNILYYGTGEDWNG